MTITICGSIKFMDEMKEAQKELEKLGHQVLMPVKAQEVDYWSEDNSSRVKAKKKYKFLEKHLDNIAKSDAILVVNITKGDIKNYIGANTFLEIGFAHYQKKKIFLLNPIPNQPYIIDELETIEPQIINGDYSLVK
jgi:nucleoside 2-deoxyribosyltransferase